MGAASIREEDYFRETIQKIISTREWFKGELTRLGFHFPDSMANFVFASHETLPAREIYEKAREEGIYVRFFDKPRINNYLRITIGTYDEMVNFIKFLSNLPNISK
jgi:histidinol-phosphate aminotransferase